MRTTLTLDDDVNAELERLRRTQGLGLKTAVNEALRRGLRAMTEPPARQRAFVSAAARLGVPLTPLDNVAESLAVAEGEGFR